MKVVKSTAEYTIYQKRNNRYAVKGADKKWLNGNEKVNVLLAEDLIKAPAPKAPEQEQEAPAEDAAETAGEESSDSSEAPAAEEETKAE